MTFLGGPLAFYELDADEKEAVLFWYFSKVDDKVGEKFTLASRAPLCSADVMTIASIILPKKKAPSSVSGLDIFNKF
jgi:hypothetical protein